MIVVLDHILIGVPDLKAGMAWWESLTGIRPVYGGSHESLGTHNALVALGPHEYLEILAPDPDGSESSPVRSQLSQLDGPKPTGWCYACEDAAKTVEALSDRGIRSARIPLSRATPDGVLVSWDLVFPQHELGPVIPFLIDWQDTPRPVSDAPEGCALESVVPSHPDPIAAQKLLDEIGIETVVQSGTSSSLQFRFETPRGAVLVE